MQESKADLILHPVRIRIIGLLVGGRHLTAQEMVQLLGNVPLPSLYRHLNKLVNGGILTITDEHRVRGTVEKVYGLLEGQANLTSDDLAHASRDDHMRFFMTFIASLLDDFARYLQQEKFDLLRDGVGYRQIPLYLSDEEFVEFAKKIQSVYMEAAMNKPAPVRHRRMISTIVMPEPKSSSSQEKG
ncbi:MAG: transcriptional regulator [Paenibacillus sp. RIFOXYA1_FULL_44_5]|nr:MAG: transcriptional regulator [Paenibacillus sp. RIFOXYA1_FULL_44_5]